MNEEPLTLPVKLMIGAIILAYVATNWLIPWDRRKPERQDNAGT